MTTTWCAFSFILTCLSFSCCCLVMGDNLLLLFVGWEGVGLCSYLLIGFWYHDHNNTIAGNKAFIVNRIGDLGFILGHFRAGRRVGAPGYLDPGFRRVAEACEDCSSPATITLITFLLFVGAAGKSAQLPLFVWLPDAMAGPTPVSALIHAATMVTAGVYMTARLHFLFALAPATLGADRCDRRGDGLLCRDHRADAKRYQESPGLFDGEPAGLHVSRRRRGRFRRGDFSRLHPCVFQSLLVPRLG